MFKHLLVPLDGSSLAETVLPAAAYLARALGATVTLVHVIEHNAPQEVHGEHHLSDPDEANTYLEGVAERAFPPDVHVDQHVHSSEVGNVARSLVEHVQELAPDLIVMCSHGKGGLRGFLFGNIAQKVIGLGTTPVLLIQPPETGEGPPFTCQRLLVPVDGQPEHEGGLAAASELALACSSAVHFVYVVPTVSTLKGERAATGRLLPGATAALLDLDQQTAESYLRARAEPLKNSGITVTAEVARGEPAATIVSTAGRIGADMIVLGTHGKAGVDAFWSGSTAAKVARETRTPLLLVRAGEK